MSKGDHQLIKIFHKQMSIVESMVRSHMEECPEWEKAAELSEEMIYLYKLAKTVGERMRELALFRGMVMSLRQENAKLRNKAKEIEQQKKNTAKIEIAQAEQEIPLPFAQNRFSTQRIDIINKKNFTQKQKEDVSYQEKEAESAQPQRKQTKKIQKKSTPIILPQEKPENQEPLLDPIELLAEKEKAIRSMMKKYNHISDTVVLPLIPETQEPYITENAINNKELYEEEEEETLWPTPTSPVVVSSPANKESKVKKEAKKKLDKDLDIDLILIPEEVEVAIKLPEDADSTESTQKIDDIEEEYLGEKEVLKLLQIEQDDLNQIIESGNLHPMQKDGHIVFDTKKVYELRSKTMELETIMLEKKKMKKTISRLQKFYRDQIE